MYILLEKANRMLKMVVAYLQFIVYPFHVSSFWFHPYLLARLCLHLPPSGGYG
jgi:hypothetical protein